MNAGEELLKVRLDNTRVLRLTKDFEQIVVANEIKARKSRAFLFEKFREGLLAALQLIKHCGEIVLQVWHVCQRNYARVCLDSVHIRLEIFVDATKAGLLVGQRPATKNRFKVNPLALDRIEQV